MKLHVFVLGLAVAILAAGALMCWDNRCLSAFDYRNKEKQNDIPEDAIRLRILANSDIDEDQSVKRQVRDRLVEQINSWLKQGSKPSSQEESQRLIVAHMKELEQTALDVLAQEKMPYGVKIEFGKVSFPAKWYGGEVYPAGIYKALLVTLGDGSGQNWWCVLFPPLCFVDGGTAQAENRDQNQHLNQPSTMKNIQDKDSAPKAEETEVRFFLWEALKALGSCISSVWSAIFGG